LAVGKELAPSAAADLAGEYLKALRVRLDLAAAAAGGFVERDLEMAGLRLRLRCAGAAMAESLLPPFEHLAVDHGDRRPDLTIGLFDVASTGVEPPPPVWPALEVDPGANPIARLQSAEACVLAAAGSGAITAADPRTGEAVFHVADAAAIPSTERAAPLREAINLLMSERRRWMTHAGAVGAGGRGALLVGAGGSGKSTLSLSCALAGMEIVADDYVLLETGPAVAHAMQSTAKLTRDSARRLELPAAALGPDGFEATMEGPEKALVEIAALAPGRLSSRLRIGVLVAPSVARLAEPALEPISPGGALRALAPSTIMQSSTRRPEVLAALGRLVREVPAYRLGLAEDPEANAAVVAGLVDELG
jgi:hypothetical protein